MAYPAPSIRWTMDNTGVNAANPGTYDLTLSGGSDISYATDRIVGSRSLFMDPTDDTTGDYAATVTSPWTAKAATMTVAFWAKPTGYGWAGCGVSFGGNATNKQAIKFGSDNYGNLSAICNGYSWMKLSGLTLIGFAWNFYCLVYHGAWDVEHPENCLHGFRNRTKSTTFSEASGATDPFPLNNSIAIGRTYLDWASPYWYYNGSGYMDNVMVWAGTQLTDVQVMSVYDATAPKYGLQPYA